MVSGEELKISLPVSAVIKPQGQTPPTRPPQMVVIRSLDREPVALRMIGGDIEHEATSMIFRH